MTERQSARIEEDARSVGVRSVAFAVVVLVALALVAAPGVVAADGPTVECGTGDGQGAIVGQTDSALTYEYNHTSEVSIWHPDTETVHLENGSDGWIRAVATGPTEVRIEGHGVDRTCLGAVDATDSDVTVSPEHQHNVTLDGTVEALAFQAVDFEADDVVEVASDASTAYNLTVHDTGLEEGDTVVLESVDDGDVEREADVDGGGAVTFEIPDGTHELAMSEHEEAAPAPPPPPPPPDDDPAFVLEDLEVPETVEEGATFTATVVLENVGDGEGSTDVVATFADQEVTEADVELQAGADQSLEFAFDADVDPDTYDLVVEETHGGDTVETTVTVEALADDTDDDTPVEDDEPEDDGADDADDDTPVEDEEPEDDDADAADEAVDDRADDDDGIGLLPALLAIVAVLVIAAVAATVALARSRGMI